MCSGLEGSYSVGLHVFATFLILFVSLVGTVMPMMTKYIRLFRDNPFAFTVGKTAATGVLLSVSTIHLIHEGAEAFREECVYSIFKDYDPYYLLFALVAVLLMQAIDLQLAAIAERWLKANRQGGARGTDVMIMGDCADAGAAASRGTDVADVNSVKIAREGGGLSGKASPTSPKIPDAPETPSLGVESPDAEGYGDTLASARTQWTRSDASCSQHNASDHSDAACGVHGHQHLAVQVPMDMGSVRRVISAVCMEFGVTLHSVFVGLTVGLTTDSVLKPLLIALVFHQLFEGMAMGSRLVDANFSGRLEVYLALVFSFSAPAGMAVGTFAAAVSPSAMSGSGFVTMMAILDSLCGGILLYLAFTLLLGDFVADVKHYCADGLPGRRTRKIALYASLWVGMGLMAFVGKWL
ncbi:hypothetical protein LSCM1_01624 [Leishmania martiniquensis]|uniref:Iron/zinc transporter protein-like protein n=1 Tax=Leishmania martiniquensis TaxID=1580590 RepID=A0A836KI35_9TRYP|nr:hypothetical protein LSCM1_01624 [Leishmania martiniquensis]